MQRAKTWWVPKLPPAPDALACLGKRRIEYFLEQSLGTPKGASFVHWLNRAHDADASLAMSWVCVSTDLLPPEVAHIGTWLNHLFICQNVRDGWHFLPHTIASLFFCPGVLDHVPPHLSTPPAIKNLSLSNNSIQVR
jgi:hypothetical protein